MAEAEQDLLGQASRLYDVDPDSLHRLAGNSPALVFAARRNSSGEEVILCLVDPTMAGADLRAG